MQSFRFRVFCSLAFAAVVLVACGPSGPEVASVEGTVTLDGKPLEGALVLFTPVEGGRPAAGRTDENGYYELIYTQERMGSLLGEQTVKISTYQEGDPQVGIPSVPEKVPAKYNVHTELKKTVDRGDNVFDFALTSEGKIIPPYGAN